MEQESVTLQSSAPKRRGERVDKSIFRYQDQNRTEKFGVRLKHKGKEWLKAGFPTITKARQWRDSRKGRMAERRLFPEQEEAERSQAENRVPFFREYAQTWLQACRAKRLKHSTLQTYEGILKTHLTPEFGTLRLSAIDRAKVR